MAPIRTGMSPLQIFKHPVTYALIVVVSVFSGILTWVTTRADESNDKCWEEVRMLRRENTDLYRSLLVKNGIIEDIKKQPDSLRKDSI